MFQCLTSVLQGKQEVSCSSTRLRLRYAFSGGATKESRPWWKLLASLLSCVICGKTDQGCQSASFYFPVLDLRIEVDFNQSEWSERFFQLNEHLRMLSIFCCQACECFLSTSQAILKGNVTCEQLLCHTLMDPQLLTSEKEIFITKTTLNIDSFKSDYF